MKPEITNTEEVPYSRLETVETQVYLIDKMIKKRNSELGRLLNARGRLMRSLHGEIHRMKWNGQ